ncbi:hypothetical protein ACE1ET_04665 [Saccharicrinis sp. FJH62]|uniref:hypothetical protein n=1 Tax=Saccharicrinis sp. FJH62 TaxID=3344657 RepID=UPI0035D4073A
MIRKLVPVIVTLLIFITILIFKSQIFADSDNDQNTVNHKIELNASKNSSELKVNSPSGKRHLLIQESNHLPVPMTDITVYEFKSNGFILTRGFSYSSLLVCSVSGNDTDVKCKWLNDNEILISYPDSCSAIKFKSSFVMHNDSLKIHYTTF